jgi:hypothetical protein
MKCIYVLGLGSGHSDRLIALLYCIYAGYRNSVFITKNLRSI